MSKKTWFYRCQKTGVLGFLAAATTIAAARNCADHSTTWQVASVSNLSDWNEFDVSGRKLVHESGTLQGVELSAGLRCGDWRLQGQLSQLDGSRLYDGQTSTGIPVTSHSALKQLQGHLQASWNVTDSWQLGGRFSGQTTWRDIASVGAASGYPERFDWTLLSFGSQWKTALGPGQLILAAWVGTPLSSSMTLNLPGKDQATLPLGSIREHELEAGWRTQLSPDWNLQADIRYRRTTIDQGADVVIKRSGLPVGVAHQPRTTVTDMPVTIRIGYEF